MALVLASSSPIRRAMLEKAGVEFAVIEAPIDEQSEKMSVSRPADVATNLAMAKALEGSRTRADDWVIGSDSIASVDQRIFSKPNDRREAVDHLKAFSGRAMQLTSAVALARTGAIDWSFCETATLQVRQLSEEFIDRYLDAEWPEVGYCVGVFRLEGRGVQLFDSIDGNYFTILGMSLLPLLGALRERGIIPS